MPDKVDLFFDDSPVWKLKPGVTGVQVPVRFAGVPKLKSGWAHGLDRLDGAAAIVEVDRGKGRSVLIGPEVALRAPTHGAVKLLSTEKRRAGKEGVRKESTREVPDH